MVSLQQVKVFHCFRTAAEDWTTNMAVAKQTGMPLRTASAHTKKLTKLGILDQVEVFPEHRFRLSAKAREAEYFAELERAAGALGLEAQKGGKSARPAPVVIKLSKAQRGGRPARPARVAIKLSKA